VESGAWYGLVPTDGLPTGPRWDQRGEQLQHLRARIAQEDVADSVLAWLIAHPDVYIRIGQLASRSVAAAADQHTELRRTADDPDHLVCRMLEEMVVALEPFAGLPEMAAGALADVAFPQPRSLREEAVKAAFKAAAHRVFEMAGTMQFDVLLKALRVGALLACPDLAEHRTLDKSCGAPLAGEVARTAVKDRLEQAADLGRIRA